jgi:hypothetical protein
MDRSGYDSDVRDYGNMLRERLLAVDIEVAFVDRGLRAVYRSRSPYHQRTKIHAPPLSIAQGTTTDELVNNVFAHLNKMYSEYNGLLIKEDLKSHVVINNLTFFGYYDDAPLHFVLTYQATVIHVSEQVELSTRIKNDESKVQDQIPATVTA